MILYVSTHLEGNAAAWWFTLVQNNLVPVTLERFKALLTLEFVPDDHYSHLMIMMIIWSSGQIHEQVHDVRRARDRLRKLQQSISVAKYLSDF